MARPAGVQVEGLDEFRRELRKLEDPKTWTREFTKVNRTVAREVAGWAQSEAAGMGGPFAHFAGSIKGMATQRSARVQIDPKANATFWGAKAPSGWNAGNGGGRPQHPDWVGVAWDVGGPGGPYAINPTIARHANDIVDSYGDGLEDLARDAFNK